MINILIGMAIGLAVGVFVKPVGSFLMGLVEKIKNKLPF